MTREYVTEAVVLGYRKLGEADRIVDLFTESQGRVPTVAKGVRKVLSRWGGRLEPFTHLQVQLHAGRSLDTLTSADTISTHAGLRDKAACLQAGLSLAEMITRSTPERHKKPRTYNLLLRYLEQMDRLCRKPADAVNAHELEDEPAPGQVPAAAVLTLAAQLKILLLAGFLPQLGVCAVCGNANDLVGFSAQSGGAVCAECDRKSFAVSGESLSVMRLLLESPLADAAAVELSLPSCRQIRRAVGEICEFHLGIRLKVEPW